MHVTYYFALKPWISFQLDTNVAGVLVVWIYSEFWLIPIRGIQRMQGMGYLCVCLVKLVGHCGI